jgi:NTP pyrophosphatase (non-canonical NTP hydrolase)
MSNFSKNPQYKPNSIEQKMGYLVEECGEVLAATGKSLRWGLDSFNPELPSQERESNRLWLKRELADLKLAISLVEIEL